MIIGECPYPDCGAPLWIPMAAKTPAFQRHICDASTMNGCGRVIWTFHSRLNPWSMTEEDFLATYEIDEATKQISEKPKQ